MLVVLGCRYYSRWFFFRRSSFQSWCLMLVDMIAGVRLYREAHTAPTKVQWTLTKFVNTHFSAFSLWYVLECESNSDAFFSARPDMRVQSVYVWMFCLLAVFHIRSFHPQLFRWNVQLSSYLFSLNIFDEFVVFLLISLCGGSRSMNVKLIFFLVFFVSLLFEPVHIKENTVRTASIRHTMNWSPREDPISKVSEMCASPGMDFDCVRRAKCLCPLWIIAHCAQIQNDRLNNS